MSEEAAEAVEAEEPLDGEEEGEGAEGQPKGLFTRKKLIMFGGAGVVVLGLVGGAGWYFGLLDTMPAGAKDAPIPVEAVYFDLPEMVVNLSTQDKRRQYLKLQVALEVADEATVSAVKPNLPRVLDAFQVYLRELRPTDLDGSAGVYRLKEELLRRINMAVHPYEVDKILFKEILVQ